MKDVEYGLAPQREYKKGISLNIWQICIVGLVVMLMLDNFTVGKIHKSLSVFAMLFVFIVIVVMIFPSFNNYGYRVFQELLFSVKFVCRRIYERILKHV